VSGDLRVARKQKPKNLKQIKAEILDEEYEPVREKRGLLWWFFRAPGAFFMWWDYVSPSKGRVQISSRQRGHVVFEVINSLIFWFVLLPICSVVFLLVLVAIVGKLKGS
jgi:hypothetical protein